MIKWRSKVTLPCLSRLEIAVQDLLIEYDQIPGRDDSLSESRRLPTLVGGVDQRLWPRASGVGEGDR